MSNIIAIVGRPNVGKSTFYNRLIGQRQAITEDVPGVTRDRQYGMTEWNGKQFTVVDTGGFVPNPHDLFEESIREQVQIAIEEASALIFMVDVTTGITDLDEMMADLLRRTDKPVFVAVNKVDNSERYFEANEFWSLGFEHTYFISSLTGSGTGDLLDALTEHLDDTPPQLETDLPRFAIVGQPNVGKSSLLNALLGEARTLVTPIAGTTRDSIHSIYNKFGKKFMLVDTAGIRKKSKVRENIEFYSVMRAVKAIEQADVVWLMIDATLGIESQDLKILRLAQRRKKGVIILVNKWDAVEKDTHTAKAYEQALKARIAPFTDVPILFISALEKTRIFKAVEAALAVYENRQRKIKTSQLNELLLPLIEKNPPPMHRGKRIKIKYVTQLPLAYPAFAFFCNHPKYVKEHYKSYLENQIRKHFDFTGVPIAIFFREK